jgi:hypothetical protein
MEKLSNWEFVEDAKDTESHTPPEYELPITLEDACIIGCLPQVRELYMET